MFVESARWHRLPVNHRGDWLFVEITNADGVTGWGEASHSGDDAQAGQTLQRLCTSLTDSEVPDSGLPETIAVALAQARSDKPMRTALSAIEQAITDVQARVRQQSVAQMIGGAIERSQIPIYTNLNRMCADRSPDTVADAGKQAVSGGVTQMKFAPFDEVSVQALTDGAKVEELVQPGRERLAALRAAVGPNVKLMIDCHWRFSPGSIAALADIVREFSICWIEDPFPTITHDLADALRAQTGALITGGEQLLTLEQYEQYLESSGVDVLISDVKHVGGVRALNQICRLAADKGIAFAPHNPSGPISTAASAHVCAANENANLLEFPFGEVAWRNEFAAAETIRDQQITVDGPGLGVSLNLTFIK